MQYPRPCALHVFDSFQLETTSWLKEIAVVLDELERGGTKGFNISDDEDS
jgi:hypothetical protein